MKIDQLNQTKKRYAILNLVTGLLLLPLLIVLVLVIRYKHVVAVITVLLLMIISAALFILGLVKYYQLKQKYFIFLCKKINQIASVVSYQYSLNKIDLKNTRIRYKDISVLPYGILSIHHLLEVEHKNMSLKSFNATVMQSSGESSTNVFDGMCYEIDLENNFEHTLVTNSKQIKNKKMTKKIFGMYYGYAANIENPYFEKLLALLNGFDSKKKAVALYESKCYICFETDKKRFKYTPFKDIEIFDPFKFEEDLEDEANRIYSLLKDAGITV